MKSLQKTTVFRFLVMGLVAGIGGVFFEARAAAIHVDSGLSVQVEEEGRYTVTFAHPAWTFGGMLAFPVQSLRSESGVDTVGSYQQLNFETLRSSPKKSFYIRAYERVPVVLFSSTLLEDAKNSGSFPELSAYPQNLHRMSFEGNFGVLNFSKMATDSPWVYFNDQAETFILSPASHYMVTQMQEKKNVLSVGILSNVKELPKNFQRDVVLVATSGINAAFDVWGHTLTDLAQKQRPFSDADTSLKKIGYWTDRGGTYYYEFAPQGAEGTLLAVRDEFRHAGDIDLGYIQLDSWWYPKGSWAQWSRLFILSGIHTYRAASELFPRGLKAFQEQLELPLLTHSRWIDSGSPYKKSYKMSGAVITDPLWWHETMSYLKDSGVFAYEQDWLSDKAQTRWNLTDPDLFMGNMASAAQEQGLTLQYCMPWPRHYLQGSLYSNLTSIRVSNDRFERKKWREFLYGSRLASALGEWPWTDVFMSREKSNLLLSVLSAGIVGVGDPLGQFDWENLSHAVRKDGVIVKPDQSLLPLDMVYVNEAKRLKELTVAQAQTRQEALVAHYVFAFDPWKSDVAQTTEISAQDLGETQPVYVWNVWAGQGRRLAASDKFTVGGEVDGSYHLVVPVGASGIAFLGDLGKFASWGRQRIANISDNGALKFRVSFSTREKEVVVSGWAPAAPKIDVQRGHLLHLAYDAATGIFHAALAPNESFEAIAEMHL